MIDSHYFDMIQSLRLLVLNPFDIYHSKSQPRRVEQQGGTVAAFGGAHRVGLQIALTVGCGSKNNIKRHKITTSSLEFVDLFEF